MEYPFKDLLPLDEVLAREGYYKDWTHLDPEVFYSLTQISEYIKTKGYGVDVRLLIAQLAEHFGLKTTQVVDLANLLQQKFTNLEGVTQSFTNNINSLVAQMEADKNTIVANATVDSEVILARGGKATLGQRLDETAGNMAVYASDFGVSHLNTAAQNTNGIRSAVAKAELENKYLILPVTPLNQPILVNDKITISQNNFTLTGYGKSTHIHCESLDTFIFIINGDNCDVGNFNLTGTEHLVGDSPVGIGSVGVQVNGNNVHVHDVSGDLLTTLVRFRNQDLLQIDGGKATNIKSGQRVSFGLLFGNINNFYYDKIEGSYSFTPSRGEPPHLIYGDHTDGYNYNVNGGICFAEGGTGSYAYQFKGCVDGNLGILEANACRGVAHIQDCEDVSVREVISRQDTWDEQTAGSLYINADTGIRNKNITIEKVSIKMGDAKAIYCIYTDDATIKNVEVETNHKLSGPMYPDVHLAQSNNCKLINPIVKNIGSIKREASIKIQSGAGNVVDNPETFGNSASILFEDSNTGINVLKNYDLNKQDAPANIRYESIVSADNYIDVRSKNKEIASYRVLSAHSGSIPGFTETGHEIFRPFGTIRARVLDGYLEADSGVSVGSIAYIDTGYKNISIECDLLYKNHSGHVVRFVDNNNYIISELTQTAVNIRARINGSFVTLVSQAKTTMTGRFYHLKTVVYDNDIEIYIDGEKITSHTLDTANATLFGSSNNFGVYGIGTLASRFSNVKWNRLTQ